MIMKSKIEFYQIRFHSTITTQTLLTLQQIFFFNLRRPDSKIKINIFDIFGRNIKQLTIENIISGQQSVNWDGKNNMGIKVPSGLYFYEITSESFIAKGKMTFLK